MIDRKRHSSACFREGPEGFRGGLTAGKYGTITGASPPTTTRDLVDLVAKGALVREGERRHARYRLSVPINGLRESCGGTICSWFHRTGPDVPAALPAAL
jgi:hypothetical protein